LSNFFLMKTRILHLQMIMEFKIFLLLPLLLL
jgi:hypothetical protein